MNGEVRRFYPNWSECELHCAFHVWQRALQHTPSFHGSHFESQCKAFLLLLACFAGSLCCAFQINLCLSCAQRRRTTIANVTVCVSGVSECNGKSWGISWISMPFSIVHQEQFTSTNDSCTNANGNVLCFTKTYTNKNIGVWAYIAMCVWNNLADEGNTWCIFMTCSKLFHKPRQLCYTNTQKKTFPQIYRLESFLSDTLCLFCTFWKRNKQK